MNIKLVTAGAGTGKTYNISEKIRKYIQEENGSIERLMVTTFTNKAANELRERIKKDLVEAKFIAEAQKVDNAWIGTVHSLGFRLIEIFSFESGFAPEQNVIPEEDESMLFARAMALGLKNSDYKEFNRLALKLDVIDWQKDILAIIRKARENDIDLSNHERIAETSIEKFRDIISDYMHSDCPETIVECQAELNKTSSCIENIQSGRVKKKKTQLLEMCRELSKYYEEKKEPENFEKLFYELNKWNSKEEETLACIKEAREHLNKCWLYHFFNKNEESFDELYSGYIKKLFRTAEKIYSIYQDYKKERGWVDYSDQENEFMNLLRKEEVKQYIGNNFDKLLVDEFQDTNPMQLAIFSMISGSVKESFFVGDPKQSIYSFRGTDPELIMNVYRDSSVNKEESLNTSRRSRKPLVEFSNKIFQDLFPGMEVKLKHWEEKLPEHKAYSNSLNIWKTEEKLKQEDRIEVMANYLVNYFVPSGKKIRDKLTGKIRDLQPGDIAILCRSNARLMQWSGIIEKLGLEVSAERNGFNEQAEVVYILAALDYLVNPGNTLAISELAVLGDPDYAGKPEKVIDSRLDHLKNSKEGWLTESPVIARLAELAEDIGDLCIKEILEEVILRLDIYSHVTAWGNSTARKANIQGLLELSEKYMNRSINYGEAMNLQGFISWIRMNEDLKQKPSASENAVKIMTYHGAKGLEWPVVLLDQLDSGYFDDWHGVEIINPAGEFDMASPLKDRELFFLHSPFGRKWHWSRKEYAYDQPPGFIKDKINESHYYKTRRNRELEESKRLLYVGITRARDYLILPEPKKKNDGWWSRTGGTSRRDLFESGSDFMIDDEIDVKVEHISEYAEKEPENQRDEYYYRELNREINFEAANISPSDFLLDEKELAAITVKEYYSLPGERLCGGLNENDLGDAFHNIMAAWRPGTGLEERREMISFLLDSYRLKPELKEDSLDQRIMEFYKWLEKSWPDAGYHREVPLRMEKDGKVYSGFADMVMENGEHMILIDHKSFQGVDAVEHSKKYISQQVAYMEMIESATGKKVSKALLFYPVTGKIVELIKNNQ